MAPGLSRIDAARNPQRSCSAITRTAAIIAVGARRMSYERDDGTSRGRTGWWIDAIRGAVRDAVRGDGSTSGDRGVGEQHGSCAWTGTIDRPAAKLGTIRRPAIRSS